MDTGDERISRLLKDVGNSLKIAEDLTSLSLDEFLGDVRNRYTLRLALVEIVEAMTSLGLYILRERLKTEAEGYIAVFRKLVENGVISKEVGDSVERLTRLRNLIIHRYWEVDDARVYREAREGGLNIIKRFVDEVRSYASGS
ncbi:MAG: type VII toxin-antitoxin system HepT family RNase toxin [Thermoproteota archaeon]